MSGYIYTGGSTLAIRVCVQYCRNRVVEDMRNLDRMKDEYGEVQIPLSVLR